MTLSSSECNKTMTSQQQSLIDATRRNQCNEVCQSILRTPSQTEVISFERDDYSASCARPHGAFAPFALISLAPSKSFSDENHTCTNTQINLIYIFSLYLSLRHTSENAPRPGKEADQSSVPNRCIILL